MAQEKYVGNEDLSEIALSISKELDEKSVEHYLTGSIASVLKGEKERANDIDFYIPEEFLELNQKVGNILENIGFVENEKHREDSKDWQNIQQFVYIGEPIEEDGKTKHIWLDVFYDPIIWNPYLESKVEENLYIAKTQFEDEETVVEFEKIIGSKEEN